jgi:hypothetical protein
MPTSFVKNVLHASFEAPSNWFSACSVPASGANLLSLRQVATKEHRSSKLTQASSLVVPASGDAEARLADALSEVLGGALVITYRAVDHAHMTQIH